MRWSFHFFNLDELMMVGQHQDKERLCCDIDSKELLTLSLQNQQTFRQTMRYVM